MEVLPAGDDVVGAGQAVQAAEPVVSLYVPAAQSTQSGCDPVCPAAHSGGAQDPVPPTPPVIVTPVQQTPASSLCPQLWEAQPLCEQADKDVSLPEH